MPSKSTPKYWRPEGACLRIKQTTRRWAPESFGSGERISAYEVDDRSSPSAVRSGCPKGAIVIKASGAIEKFYSSDLGATLLSGLRSSFGTDRPARRAPKSTDAFAFIPTIKCIRIGSTTASPSSETVFVLNRLGADRPRRSANRLRPGRHSQRFAPKARVRQPLRGAAARRHQPRRCAVHDAKLGAIDCLERIGAASSSRARAVGRRGALRR